MGWLTKKQYLLMSSLVMTHRFSLQFHGFYCSKLISRNLLWRLKRTLKIYCHVPITLPNKKKFKVPSLLDKHQNQQIYSGVDIYWYPGSFFTCYSNISELRLFCSAIKILFGWIPLRFFTLLRANSIFHSVISFPPLSDLCVKFWKQETKRPLNVGFKYKRSSSREGGHVINFCRSS